ncbi:MAG TPA: EAL domain-containing protein [Wenzhouxiangella sp.]|nr:EAL domain-containing protein [Wenzhouxiangella sp.]
MLTADPSTIDRIILEALGRTGRLLAVDRCSLFLFSESTSDLDLTHGWEAEGVAALPLKAMGAVPAAKLFPTIMSDLLNRGVLAVTDSKDAPELDAEESRRIYQLGLRSVLLVPMFAGDQGVGLVGVDLATRTREWDREEAQFLDDLGRLLTHTLLRVRAEQTVKRMTERYEALTQKSQSIFFEIDRHGRYTFVSSNVEAMTGHRAQDIIGQSFKELLHPDDVEGLLSGFSAALADSARGRPALEYRVIHADETAHWHRSVLVPLQDTNGQVRGIVGSALDITDLKELEVGLRNEAGLTQLLVRLATEYINLPSSGFESAISRSLKDLGEFVDADRAYVFRYDLEQGLARNTHEWCAAGVTPQIDNLQAVSVDEIPDFVDCHKRGQTFYIPRVAVWPNEATRELLQGQAIQSVVTVPLMLEEECLGFVGFDYVHDVRAYSESEIYLLSVFAQMLVNMRVRRDIERKLSDERRRLGDIIDGTDSGTWEWDLDSGRMSVNDRWIDLLGVSSRDDLPRNPKEWLAYAHPEDIAPAWERMIKHLKDELPALDIEIRVRRSDDEWLWILVRGQVSKRSSDGRARLMSGIAVDIDQRKNAEAELRKAASVFTYSGEGILITDPDGKIVEINESFTRITGYTRDEILGQQPSLLASGRHDDSFYSAMWRDLLNKGAWSGELWNRRRDGSEYAQRLTISSVADAAGQTTHYVGLFSDITEQKNHERDLERMAHFDALTGLPNRVLLADRLSQAMSQARRSGQLIAVVYIDLDNFKVINDRHGHHAGDQVLREIGGRIAKALRETDTVARPGGDEFVAILTGLTDQVVPEHSLTRLLEAMSKPIQLEKGQVQVGLSIGVTLYPQIGKPEADQLLRQADQAMFEAKRKGRNSICYFDTNLEQVTRQRLMDQNRLREALENEEFVLYYQPQIDLRRGAVSGVEALIRWNHPEKGLLSPGAFMPLIEDESLAIAFGEWVRKRALEDHRHWMSGGLDLDLAVNVDAADLLGEDFVARLEFLLDENPDFPARRLLLEVVETSVLEDLGQATVIAKSCKKLGVALALDDFGTGFSSLSHLKHLPIQQLKIDRTFVFDMMADADDLAIVEAVINLGRVFRLDVLAEGAETAEQVEALIQLGCRQVQGYFIAKPMPAKEVAGWVEFWRAPKEWFEIHPLSEQERLLLFSEADLRLRLHQLGELVRSQTVPSPVGSDHDAGATLPLWLARFSEASIEGYQAVDISKVGLSEAALLKMCAAGKHDDAETVLDELTVMITPMIESLRTRRRKTSRASASE